MFVSHAHFDHLLGADTVAKNTGAPIVGSYESIRVMRDNGVEPAQLWAVSGGERVDCGATILERAVAALQTQVEQLAAVTEQPVVVQRENDRNTALLQLEHDPRRKTGQVVDMGDVRTNLVDEVGGQGGDGWVLVRFLERTRLAKRVVDPSHAQTVAALIANAVLGRIETVLSGQDRDVVAIRIAQPCRERMSVRLGSTTRQRRKPVHHLKDAHHTPAGRQCGRPLTAVSPPRY